jgi:hypothetical protein
METIETMISKNPIRRRRRPGAGRPKSTSWIDADIAQRVAMRLHELRRTRKQLAEATQIPVNSLYGWLHGTIGINQPRFDRVMQFLEAGWQVDSMETIETPIQNCVYKDAEDGTCGHESNMTPECHQWACPLLRILDREIPVCSKSASCK